MLHGYITKCIWEGHAYVASSLYRIFKCLRCCLEKQSSCHHFLSSLLELRWFCSLFFWNRNSLLNCNFFSLSRQEQSVVVDFTVVPVWGTIYLLCETEYFSVIPVTKGCIFPVSERENLQRIVKFCFKVIQISTSIVSLGLQRQVYVKPDYMHTLFVCLNRFVHAV